MEVHDFADGVRRICKENKNCNECLLRDAPQYCCGFSDSSSEEIKKVEKIVLEYIEKNRISNSEKVIEVLKETFYNLPDFSIENKGDGIATISVSQDWLTEDYKGGIQC